VGRYSVYNGVGRNPDFAESPPRSRQRPRNPADVAQSALFAAVLLDEIDELEDRASAAERRWQRRCERTPDEVVILPTELTELRQRIAEAGRMLDALRKRFPAE
jgi:epoxyqueuosine reductase QueG